MKQLLVFVLLLALDLRAGDLGSQAQTPGTAAPIPEFLVIDLDGNGLCFTSVEQGVTFRFDTRTAPMKTAWTCAGRSNAFLFRDGGPRNGVVDGAWELVGGRGPSWNGFEELLHIDGRILKAPPGIRGRADHRFDAADEEYSTLQLWCDRDHIGFSKRGEPPLLVDRGLISIDLDARKVSEADAVGNVITRRGVATLQSGNEARQRPAVTVRFAR